MKSAKKDRRVEIRISEEELHLIEYYCALNEIKLSKLVRDVVLEHISDEMRAMTNTDASTLDLQQKIDLLYSLSQSCSRDNLMRRYEQNIDTPRFKKDPYWQIEQWLKESACQNSGFPNSKAALEWLKVNYASSHKEQVMDRSEKLRKNGFIFDQVIMLYRKNARQRERSGPAPQPMVSYDGVMTFPDVHDTWERMPLAFSGFDDLGELVIFLHLFVPLTSDQFNGEYLKQIAMKRMPERFVTEHDAIMKVMEAEGRITYSTMERCKDLYFRIINDPEAGKEFTNTVMVSDWFENRRGRFAELI